MASTQEVSLSHKNLTCELLVHGYPGLTVDMFLIGDLAGSASSKIDIAGKLETCA